MIETTQKQSRCEERIDRASLRDVYLFCFRYKWKMAFFFLAVTIAVTTITFLMAETYSSEARLMVRLGRESMTLDPTVTTGQTIQVNQSRQSEINSELEILRSRELIEKVVDSIGWEAFLEPSEEPQAADASAPGPFEKTQRKMSFAVGASLDLLKRLDVVSDVNGHKKAVLNLMKNLKINTSKDSSIISVSYEAKNPDLAQNVVSKIVDFYLEKHIAVHQTPGSHEFFLQQSNHMRSKLEELEDQLRNLKNETGVSSIDEQRGILVGRIGSLEQEIERSEAAFVATKAKVETLQKSLQPNLPTEKATLSSLQAQIEVQKKQLEEAQEELRTLNGSEIAIKRLMREINIEEANYQKYVDSVEQARIDHALEVGNISNISVVQPATVPIKPIRPRKMLNLALGFLLGILGAIGLAFFCDYMDHSIVTPEDAEAKLQLQTLASISIMRPSRILSLKKPGKGKFGLRLSKHRKSQDCVSMLEKSTTGNESTEIWNIPEKIKQQYASLAEQLILRSKDIINKPYVLAVVSCHRREGVSTIATNLSALLARQVNGDVLLMDADSDQPSVRQIFKNHQNDEDVVLGPPQEKLPLLTARSKDTNLSEALDSGVITKQLSTMKKSCRFVVIDMPAMDQASFVPRLSSLCDDVIMVVEAERLRWEVIRRAKEQLIKARASILGVVLNKRRFYIPAWLYQTL